MTDSGQQGNNQPDSPEGGSGDGQGQQNEPSAEDKFWGRFDERLDAAIERGVKKHLARAKSGPGTSRSGRTTLPGLIAEFMGGPFTPESKQDKK